jgi:hypothetical protein
VFDENPQILGGDALSIYLAFPTQTLSLSGEAYLEMCGNVYEEHRAYAGRRFLHMWWQTRLHPRISSESLYGSRLHEIQLNLEFFH